MDRREHLLCRLGEEANEVAQRVSKALVFGLDEVQPGQPFTNGDRICHELCDLYALVEMLEEAGVLKHVIDIDLIHEKQAKVKQYMEYSKQCGTLTDGKERR